MRKSILLFFSFSFLLSISSRAQCVDGNYLKFIEPREGYAPLDMVCIRVLKKDIWVSVEDGQGHEYLKLIPSGILYFQAGGSLGRHLIVIKDKKGRIVDKASFKVDCHTLLEDESLFYQDMLKTLCWNLTRNLPYSSVFLNKKNYCLFASSLQAHTEIVKALRYFSPETKQAPEFYGDFQEKNGMIWSRIIPAGAPSPDEKNDTLAGYRVIKNSGNYRFERSLFSSDAEYLYIESLFYAWQSSGDKEWMSRYLPHAIKALDYLFHAAGKASPGSVLVKGVFRPERSNMINSDEKNLLCRKNYPNHLPVYSGIMTGDNTGIAYASMLLAQMLEATGNKAEAEKFRNKGRELMEQIIQSSWHQSFLLPFVSKDTSFCTRLTIDGTFPLSCVNTFFLARNKDYEKNTAIVRAYLSLKDHLPPSSPGEWYTVYPPYKQTISGIPPWESLNGGVSPLIAGQLALGAFDCGMERYAIDILKRVYFLAGRKNGYLYGIYRGTMFSAPERKFSLIDLRNYVNADIGKGSPVIPGWDEKNDNELKNFPTDTQVFHHIPFFIANPDSNQHRACIALSYAGPYKTVTCIDIHQKAASLYLLHACAGHQTAGYMIITYEDHSTYTDVIGPGKVAPWNCPDSTASGEFPFRIAWKGNNAYYRTTGVGVYGLNNPFPEKEISHLELIANQGESRWYVLGITLSDAPVYLPPAETSDEIPSSCAAAVITEALINGMAGIKDEGVTFSRSIISPHWLFDSINYAKVFVRYEASDGYSGYIYQYVPDEKRMILSFSGSGNHTIIRLPLPEGLTIDRVYLNGELKNSTLETTGTSSYCRIVSEKYGPGRLIVYLK